MPDAVIRATTEASYDADFFEHAYADYLRGAAEFGRTAQRRLAWMRQWATGGNLLEIGCAYGLFLREAAGTYDPCVGVDLSTEAGRVGRERFGVDVRVGDILHTVLPEAPFDTICAWDTLEHFTDPTAAVDAIQRALKPGGHFFFVTVDIESRLARLRGRRWRGLHLPTHLHFWGRSTLQRLLDRHGLDLLDLRAAPVYRSLESVCRILAQVSPSPPLRAAARGVLHTVPAPMLARLRGFVDLGDLVQVATRKRPAA